jgi:hypothetical protein
MFIDFTNLRHTVLMARGLHDFLAGLMRQRIVTAFDLNQHVTA